MISIICGGQFGSEGKGKVTWEWAKQQNAQAIARVGGPNSGHTVYHDNKKHILRQLPVSAINKNMISILPAGSYLDRYILNSEIDKYSMTPENLKIDPNAVIITPGHILSEKHFKLNESISSTCSGTGYAYANRVKRDSSVKLAKDIPGLQPYITDTVTYMRRLLDQQAEIIIEGTQGFGLSNLHTPYYPYATARDTTASGILSEIGLSPFDVKHIVLVLRSYPIRVSGNSGPLANEIDWETITQESQSSILLQEYTSVTQKLRRVGRFDPNIVKRAINANRPDIIVMNHVDYFDKTNKTDKLSELQETRLTQIETEIQNKIDYIGLDPYAIIPR